MCRALLYLGQPALASNFLYGTDNSLVKQTYDPKLWRVFLNLAGFGLAAWDVGSHNPDRPFFYKSEALPVFDKNLNSLAEKIKPSCLLAHVRGTPYKITENISQQNCHPFYYDGYPIALAHNGELTRINEFKLDLLNYIKPELVARLVSSTDTEYIYALLLSRLADCSHNVTHIQIEYALQETLEILRDIRKKKGIACAAPLNLFVTNGQFIVATRFVLDYGLSTPDQEKLQLAYHTLWYTYEATQSQQKSSVCIASEPLVSDYKTWVEMPEYSIMSAWKEASGIKISLSDIAV